MTFERALQSGVEDYGYAVRIARLRAYYFDSAPEVTPTWPAFQQASGWPSRGCGAEPGNCSGASPAWLAS